MSRRIELYNQICEEVGSSTMDLVDEYIALTIKETASIKSKQKPTVVKRISKDIFDSVGKNKIIQQIAAMEIDDVILVKDWKYKTYPAVTIQGYKKSVLKGRAFQTKRYDLTSWIIKRTR